MFSINKKMKIIIALVLFTTTIFSLNTMSMVAAGPLDMEYSHKWSHVYVNAHDICAADVDGDGAVEIVTIGLFWDDTTSSYFAQLRIYSWDGSTFNLEINREFQVNGEWTLGLGVDIGDLGNDGILEIVVTGLLIPMSGDAPGWIRVYRWDGSALALLDTTTWTGSQAGAYAVAVGDVNNDGQDDVVTGGYMNDGTDQYAQLKLWSWNGGLNPEDSEEWLNAGEKYKILYDVDIGEINDHTMIAAGGKYYNDAEAKNDCELSLWSSGSPLTTEELVTWEAVGSSQVKGVFIAYDKIYTIGYTNDGTSTKAQLRVWSLGSLTLEDSKEWLTGDYTWGNGVYVGDVDGDGEEDIVAVSQFNDGTREQAQLKIGNYEFTIDFKDTEEWYSIDSTAAEAVYVADVDDDGVPEILTAGAANNWESGQVTIWSYPDDTDPTITDFMPSSGSEVSDLKPTITATLNDDFSGIDVDSVTLEVDGVDVTSGVTITVTGISYTPSSDLSEGDVVVSLEVSDKSGNTETATWTFTVKAPAPGIPGFPLEGILVGIAVTAMVLLLLRKRTISSGSMTPAF